MSKAFRGLKKTNRGFLIYGKLVDIYDQTVSVVESSSAEGPRVWVFCKDKDGREAIEHLGQLQARSPHLTPAQARRVAKALLRFADTSKERWGR
jgi:hypothetical protein